MSKRPRLVISDLDGTFLSSAGTVSEENSAAVAAAQRVGLPVVFATGRPIRWLDVIAELPGVHPVVIASNGAMLYDLSSNQILDRVCVPNDLALDAVTALRSRLPGTSFAAETGIRFGHEPEYQTWLQADEDDNVFTATAEEIIGEGGFVKLLVRHLELGPDELAAEVSAVVGDTLTVTHSAIRDNGLVEVSARGISKAYMLQRYAQTLAVDAADIAAFGDMPNDWEMLSWCGMPHVVANAHPRLLSMGATVVPSNDDSGVGQTIRSWLK